MILASEARSPCVLHLGINRDAQDGRREACVTGKGLWSERMYLEELVGTGGHGGSWNKRQVRLSRPEVIEVCDTITYTQSTSKQSEGAYFIK